MTSPEYLIPPSEMIGTPDPLAASEHCATAVIWGTPAPEMIRVVQIDPGPDAYLDGIDLKPDQVLDRFRGGDVSGDQIDVGHRLSQLFDGRHHSAAVAVRRVDGKDVDAFRENFLSALDEIAGRADSSADQ